MKVNYEANVSVKTILIKIGFLPTGDGLQFDFGNCKLKANHGISRQFQEGYNFYGFYISERKAGEFDFFLPLFVESFEQGLAYIAFCLRKADLKYRPDWLNEGLAFEEHLPWKRDAKAFNENPKAVIEHEWFRIMVKKLRNLMSNSSDEALTKFSFNGSVLKVECENQTIVVSGIGNDWQREATVKTNSLDFLPKRIPNENILIYIWKDKLHINNRIFNLVT
ncbi:MAG: hypothetical protein IPK88_17935 [Saprospiraceae bacterium]|nr:hypothetical protein [Candidatus Defluviibacterium haderslevense]